MDKTLICIVFVMFAGCSAPQEGAQTPVTESYPQEEARPEPEPEPEPEAQPEPPKPDPPKTQESSLAEEIEWARRHAPRSLPARHK